MLLTRERLFRQLLRDFQNWAQLAINPKSWSFYAKESTCTVWLMMSFISIANCAQFWKCTCTVWSMMSFISIHCIYVHAALMHLIFVPANIWKCAVQFFFCTIAVPWWIIYLLLMNENLDLHYIDEIKQKLMTSFLIRNLFTIDGWCCSLSVFFFAGLNVQYYVRVIHTIIFEPNYCKLLVNYFPFCRWTAAVLTNRIIFFSSGWYYITIIFVRSVKCLYGRLTSSVKI
jgi:hypothetical protein